MTILGNLCYAPLLRNGALSIKDGCVISVRRRAVINQAPLGQGLDAFAQGGIVLKPIQQNQLITVFLVPDPAFDAQGCAIDGGGHSILAPGPDLHHQIATETASQARLSGSAANCHSHARRAGKRPFSVKSGHKFSMNSVSWSRMARRL